MEKRVASNIFVAYKRDKRNNKQHLKNTKMKTTTKRFSTLELVTYRTSNTTRIVYFDSQEEAVAFATEQRKLHPRSRKLTGSVFDWQEKKTINY